MSSVQLFVILLTIGLLFVGAEIFVPDGILGTFGALALLGAVIIGYRAFPGYGTYIAFAVFFALAIALVAWIKIFPGSPIGRAMTVSTSLASAKASSSDISNFVGETGEATSDLRPAGYASIKGKRVDVVTRGEMISAGTQVRVVKVEGNRVIVTAINEEEKKA